MKIIDSCSPNVHTVSILQYLVTLLVAFEILYDLWGKFQNILSWDLATKKRKRGESHLLEDIKSQVESEDWIGKHYLVYYTYDLQVRNADIKALVHIGVPHNPNIGDKEGSKVSLKERKGTQLLILQTNYLQ